jgi:voltage-gated sodium channel
MSRSMAAAASKSISSSRINSVLSRPLHYDIFEADAKLEQQRLKKIKQRQETIDNLAISHKHRWWVDRCMALRDNRCFTGFIVAVIFLAGALVGIQTYPIQGTTLALVCEILDIIVLWTFVLEIIIKFFAEGNKPWQYFSLNLWNCFDFVIVVISFCPIGGGGAVTALRLLRLLRVLKLIKALPKLQVLVIGLIKSLSSIGYVGALLLLVFYLFAILGMGFFGENDPVHMSELFLTMLTLFRAATLEDWTDIMYIGMYGCENYGYQGIEHLCVKSNPMGFWAALYWIAFVLISNMMILNLFIGVIASSMADAQCELNEEEASKELGETDESLQYRLTEIHALIQKASVELDTFSKEETKQIEKRKEQWNTNNKIERGASMFGGLLSGLKKNKVTKAQLIQLEKEEDDRRHIIETTIE